MGGSQSHHCEWWINSCTRWTGRQSCQQCSSESLAGWMDCRCLSSGVSLSTISKEPQRQWLWQSCRESWRSVVGVEPLEYPKGWSGLGSYICNTLWKCWNCLPGGKRRLATSPLKSFWAWNPWAPGNTTLSTEGGPSRHCTGSKLGWPEQSLLAACWQACWPSQRWCWTPGNCKETQDLMSMDSSGLGD